MKLPDPPTPPKPLNPTTHSNIDKLLQEIQDEQDSWTWYQNAWFEITYFFNNISSNIRSFKQSIKNLIKYRSLIWNDRWYDHSFLTSMLRFKLNDMSVEWKNAHYVGSEYEENILKELVEILDKIEQLEEGFDKEGELSNLYQEFGIKLFSIQKVTKVDKEFGKDGECTTVCSNIERLWD